MKLLSKFQYITTRKYRAVTTCDVVLDLERGYLGDHVFCFEEKILGLLHDDELTIFAGYASDLCSPGFYLFGKWYGTPSRGKELESILHDFTRQFMNPRVPCSPWDRKATDDIFFDGMRSKNAWGKEIYHGAVAGPVGNFWNWMNKPRPNVTCKLCQPSKQS